MSSCSYDPSNNENQKCPVNHSSSSAEIMKEAAGLEIKASLGTERLGTERLGTERLGTERLGTEREGIRFAISLYANSLYTNTLYTICQAALDF